jgi:hypothetical protein
VWGVFAGVPINDATDRDHGRDDLAVEITSKRQLFEKEATVRPSPLVTVAAAAERLAVSRSLIRKLLKSGSSPRPS